MKTYILVAFVLLKIVLQYLLVTDDYELHRDEFLHLDQAKHLAWGYQSVPPVTSWISTVIAWLGNTPFWIRFFPALFGALTIIVVWRTVEELGGGIRALVLAATCVLLSALLRLNLLYHPNSLDVLCWTLFYFTLIRYVNSQHVKWFYFGMVALAIGFLNKYNVVFLALGVLPAFLFANFSVLKNKHVYFSILLFLLLISPNLIWQIQRDFPVLRHMRELAETQLVHVNRADFFKEQLVYFLGALPVMGAGLYSTLFYAPFKKYRFLFWSLIITLCVFTYFRAKGYYAIGIYPIYIALGAAYLGRILHTRFANYIIAALLLPSILFFAYTYQVAFPNKSPEYIAAHGDKYKALGLLRWEDGKEHSLPQDFADMLGWKELAAKVDSVYDGIADKKHTIILCDNYGQAGGINYYTKHKALQAVSFNADYIDWMDLDRKIINVIRVKTFESEGDEMKETGPLFKLAYQAGQVTNRFAREYGASIFVFLGAKVDVNQRIADEIEEEKK